MKTMHLLARFAIIVIFTLILADALLSGRGGLSLHPVWDFIWPDGRLTPRTPFAEQCYLVAGLLLVALYVVTSLVIWMSKPKAMRVRTSSGETLLIHRGALIKFVRLRVEAHPAVVTQKIRVNQAGSRGLAVTANVNVRPIQSLPSISRQLESSIRDGFAQVMGIEKIDRIDVILGLDEKSMGTGPGVDTPARPEPEPPVKGALTHTPADEDDYIPARRVDAEPDADGAGKQENKDEA